MSAPSRGDTTIGNDVWLGYQALVLPGVTIGHGAVVAAASVVAGNVDPYTVVAGNPRESCDGASTKRTSPDSFAQHGGIGRSIWSPSTRARSWQASQHNSS